MSVLQSFLHPAWLLLLPFPPLLLAWRWFRGAAARAVAADPAGLPRSLRQRLVALPTLLLLLALTLSVFALARPVKRIPLPVVHAGIDVMLVLDVSSSMRGLDLDPNQNRLQVAVAAAQEFIEARPHDRIGLVRFARYTDLRCPPTLDHAALLQMLEAEQPMEEDAAEDATGIGAAVALAAEVLAGADSTSKVVVLLTDGEENVAGRHAPEAIAPLHAGQFGAEVGVRVHAITVGKGRRAEDGSLQPIDTRQVEALAQQTGGRAWTVQDARALRSVYAEIDAMETAPAAEQRFRIVDHYPILIRGALLHALLAVLLALGPLRVRPGGLGRTSRLLAGLALLAVAGAAFDPRGTAVETLPIPGEARILCCLDLSRSMLAADLRPSRLGRAQQDLRAMVESAPGEKFGLVGFSGEAQLRVPLTADGRSFIRLVEEAHPRDLAIGGTDLGAALDRAATALGAEGGTVLLLSDGEDRDGQGLAAARRLAERGVRVHAIGYGTSRGARIAIPVAGGEDFVRDAEGTPVLTRLVEEDLRAIAAAGGGSYRTASSGSAPLQLYREGALRAMGDSSAGLAAVQRRPLYGYPLTIALLCALCAAAWRRGGQR